MNSYIFYLTDSLGSTTAVVGTGADHGAAESGALAKWDATIGARVDYADRTPIVASTFSMLGSIEDVPTIEVLRGIMGTDTDETMPGLIQ